MHQRVVIIGLGGIGSILSEHLCRYLNFKKDDSYAIVLVDGKTYRQKNEERQTFSAFGNKARVKASDLRMKFDRLMISEFDEYITPDNINDIIKEDDIILLCVDNHKTRKLISKHILNFNNIIIISGGNELYDGNIQITIKEGGEFITANLTDYHPEIDNPDDKSPDEMSCQELENSEPQIIFTNMTAATLMCCAFHSIDIGTFDINKIGEVYFDVNAMSVVPHVRKPRN